MPEASRLLLPPGEERLDAILPLLKAVVFTGGGDIDPDLYGGSHHETIYMVEPERDRTEIELARRVFDLGVPTLAICRGSQILNVSEGGTLIEHLPDEVGRVTVNHRVPPREPTPHPDTGGAGIPAGRASWAPRIFRACRGTHQAIRRVAPGFEVVAHAPDGTIEGLEMPSHPWLVAVQWHPGADGGGRPGAAAPVRRAGGGHGRALSAGTDSEQAPSDPRTDSGQSHTHGPGAAIDPLSLWERAG